MNGLGTILAILLAILALQLACRMNMLIKAGAIVYCVGKHVLRPLHYVAERRDSVKIVFLIFTEAKTEGRLQGIPGTHSITTSVY